MQVSRAPVRNSLTVGKGEPELGEHLWARTLYLQTVEEEDGADTAV